MHHANDSQNKIHRITLRRQDFVDRGFKEGVFGVTRFVEGVLGSSKRGQ